EGMCAMRDKGREMISRHKHPSARYLLEWLRRDSNVKLDDCGGQYKIANIFSPILARIFVRDFPEFKEHFNLAKSEFDEVELPTIDWS
ncbi:MAG: hypothetical protein IJ125_05600, partial [Atopobiaceae bacterium]|nr:hypothetical protein [Atopobiaceae bacterium]